MATSNVEALRDEYVRLIAALADDLESVASPARLDWSQRPPDAEAVANRLITLAGTYGFDVLAKAACRLCDLVSGLTKQSTVADEAIAAHIRAIRLFLPESPNIGPEASRCILQELRRVLEHFAITVPEESFFPDLGRWPVYRPARPGRPFPQRGFFGYGRRTSY
jgi:hypothetical protein